MLDKNFNYNDEKIIIFLKNNPINKFYSFSDIDKKFNLPANTAYKKYINYFRIAIDDIYKENNTTYYSMKAISDFLSIEYSRVRHLFPQIKPPHIKLYFKSAKNKKLTIKKFYHLDKIINLLPKKYQNVYKIVNSNFNNKEEFLNCNPTNLSENQYLVFRALIEFYKQHFHWPTFKKLKSYIKINFKKDFNLASIYKLIKKLEDLKYITKKYIDKNNYIYFIHKGPILLTHKEVLCYDTAFGREIKIKVPIDTYQEI